MHRSNTDLEVSHLMLQVKQNKELTAEPKQTSMGLLLLWKKGTRPQNFIDNTPKALQLV